MTTQEWALLSARIAAWWPATKWTTEMFAVWYEDLAAFDLEAVRVALNGLKMRPGAFAPSIGDVLSQLTSDPADPTFDEMVAVVFGRDGILHLRPAPRGLWREGEREAATSELVEERLEHVHPLIRAFVCTYGLRRLRKLPIDAAPGEDASGRWEDEGKWARKELRDAWVAHVAAFDGREVAALAFGQRSEGLRRLDPLAAIGPADDKGVSG